MVKLGRTLLVATVLLAGAFIGRHATGSGDATAAATQSSGVSLIDNRFAPSEIRVAAGTLVEWVNEEYASGEWHDVIAQDGSFASDVFGPGQTYAVTFWTPGTYVYYCDLHEGMFGTVIVE